MQAPIKAILLAFSFITLVSCMKEANFPQSVDAANSISKKTLVTSAVKGTSKSPMANTSTPTFKNGLLNTAIVPLADLQDLGGGLSGEKIVVSNNPEVVVKAGWLYKPPTNTAGQRIALSGKFNLYLYHDNRSGQNLYIHVFATNPNNHGITLSAKGNIYNRNQYDGKITNGQKRGFGPSYQVAYDWMINSFSTVASPRAIPNLGGYTSLAVASLPRSKTIDGLLSIESSGNCFIYVVASTSPNPATAVNLSQTNVHAVGQYWDSGAQAFVNSFKPETPNTFGRECGIYEFSGWSGDTELNLPNSPAHVGLALNTTSKFALPNTTQRLQNQNSSAIAVINNASSYSYGNYGHYYNFNLKINNHASRQRHVRVWLATNQAGSNAASFFFHAPIRTYGSLREVFNTGSSPKTLLLDTRFSWNTLNVPIQFYVPGLISAGQQIVVEVLN